MKTSGLRIMTRVFVGSVAALALTLAFIGHARAEEIAPREYTLTLENHLFTPAQLEVQAGEKIILHVVNKDDAAEEFESHSLKREKIVPAKGQIKINLGPLKPGSYEFFGEFHEKTAKGTLVAVEVPAAPVSP